MSWRLLMAREPTSGADDGDGVPARGAGGQLDGRRLLAVRLCGETAAQVDDGREGEAEVRARRLRAEGRSRSRAVHVHHAGALAHMCRCVRTHTCTSKARTQEARPLFV
eukprot:2162368-Pleurochrysis_carterae.AAC.1